MKRVSDKQKIRNEGKKEETENLHKLFLEIWDEREDEQGYCYCFETGVQLEPWKYRSNTATYDHVLEKGQGSYPQYSNNRLNIIILHPDIHQLKGRNLDKVPKIKAYREYLLSLHAEGKLNGND